MDTQALGHLTILAALAMNLIAGGAFLLQARGSRQFGQLATRGYHLFTLFTAMGSILLYFLFFSHDYRFKYVYQYSSSDQPFFYILSAFWGGQEGTYLLWVLLSAVFGYLIIKNGKQYSNYAMGVYALVNAFFLLILTKLSPFAFLPFAAPDGMGLNPLLRDPWMVVHPPIMFVGYAMVGVPFAIAMAALIKNDYKDWLKIAFPWVAMSAVMLGAGNILGAFWAYKTLGWGGFWGWDPVENSSFIPWAISLALLHGMILERRTGAFRRINIMMSAFLFLLVIYGTFLTRSGVLSDFSVHSFTDLGINNYLIFFMVLFLALSVVLFAWRAKKIPSAPIDYNLYGREFSLFVGMVLLFVTGVIVLFWSSLPVLTGIFTSEPRAADVSTYNNFALPLAVLYAMFLAYSPFSTYADSKYAPGRNSIIIAVVVAAALGFGLFYAVLGAGLTMAMIFTIVAAALALFLLKPGVLRRFIPALGALLITVVLALVFEVDNYLHLIFFVTAAMAILSNVVAAVGHRKVGLSLLGGHITHVGFGIMLIGILASGAYDSNEKLVINRNSTKAAFAREITYKGMENEITHPHNRLILDISGASEKTLYPELYFSERMDGLMKKPAIDRTILADIYMAPEQILDNTDQSSLSLVKNQPVEREGITFTFLKFDLPQHGGESEGFRVAAVVEVARGELVDTIAPAVVQRQGTDGQPLVDEQSAMFSANGKMYEVWLMQMQADAGQVILQVPALAGSGAVDRLVLDVSLKPLINMVWAGSILILLGCLIVFVRRFEEMNRTQGTKAA